MKKRVMKVPAKGRRSVKLRIKRASTAEVLARPEEKLKVPRKWAGHYKCLVELRDELSRERQTLKSDAAEESLTYSSHMADAGTDSYDRDWALGMLSSEQNAIYEIDQALDRIRLGTYGICESTGKRIDAARLLAVPWTRFSAEAERRLEREGVVGRAGLGSRGTLPRTQTETQVGEEQS